MISHSPTPGSTTISLRPAEIVSRHVLPPVKLVSISIYNTQEGLVLPAARVIWRASSQKYNLCLVLEWKEFKEEEKRIWKIAQS